MVSCRDRWRAGMSDGRMSLMMEFEVGALRYEKQKEVWCGDSMNVHFDTRTKLVVIVNVHYGI